MRAVLLLLMHGAAHEPEQPKVLAVAVAMLCETGVFEMEELDGYTFYAVQLQLCEHHRFLAACHGHASTFVSTAQRGPSAEAAAGQLANRYAAGMGDAAQAVEEAARQLEDVCQARDDLQQRLESAQRAPSSNSSPSKPSSDVPSVKIFQGAGRPRPSQAPRPGRAQSGQFGGINLDAGLFPQKGAVRCPEWVILVGATLFARGRWLVVWLPPVPAKEPETPSLKF